VQKFYGKDGGLSIPFTHEDAELEPKNGV